MTNVSIRSFVILPFLSILLVSCLNDSTQIEGNSDPMVSLSSTIITNPLWEDDFPDPHVLRGEKGWYAYATGNPGFYNIGVAFSADFSAWSKVKEALPERPNWQPIVQGLTWAPDVTRVGNRYLMIYVARHADSGLQCLSRAWANSLHGPFVDNSTTPFICQLDKGGSIDPNLFVSSSGKRFLYFKNDGNAVGLETKIWVVEVNNEGDFLHDPIYTGLKNFRSWHGSILEHPSVFEHKDKYFLTYSANDYWTENYAIGWAVSTSPLGPWIDKSLEPFLSSTGLVAGPGGQQIFRDDKLNLWIAYHAWTYGKVGYGNGSSNARSFRVDPIELIDGVLTTTGPSIYPIPKPITIEGK